jgi:hypothetical protein
MRAHPVFGGHSIIEQMFDAESTQHIRSGWRLMAVETNLRSLAVVLTRTTAMLLLAGLLILVLLPAALAASGK